MNAQTETAKWPPPRNGGELATRESLDALASDRCSPDEFLREILERFHRDRNGKWEVLAFLDQYYRRGKIKLDVFQTVKSRLAESALGARGDAEEVAPPSVAVTTPAGTHGAPAGARGRNGSAKPISAPRASAREVAIGDVLRGRYRILEVLGHGGMGTVFEALDEYRLDLPETSQHLAVKVPHTAVNLRDDLLAELQREFQHLQLLSHPNIVRVHEFDRDGDIAFFTMEALHGVLLGRILDSRKGAALPRRYALSIIRNVGAALSHAHSRGVVHGDINPQNIFLTDDGDLRVLDFGASHQLLEDPSTVNGAFGRRLPMATQGYASCQLLEGQHPDARDDLFAFACLTYVLLSGGHPFPNRTAVEACAQRWKPRRPTALTGHQWRVLREGLRWDREQRPRDVGDWLNRFNLKGAAPHLPALATLLQTPARRKSRMVLAAAGAVALALVLAVGYWALTNDDSPNAGGAAAWSAKARSALADAGGSLSRLVDNSKPAADSPAETESAASAPAPVTDLSSAPAMVRTPTNTAAPPHNAIAASSPLPAPPAASDPLQAPAAPRTSTSTLPSRPAAASSAAAVLPPAGPRVAAAMSPTIHDSAIRGGAVGAARIEMTADTVDVLPAEKTAHVVVRRRGTTRGETDFTWWTESGTAKPGMDFAPATPRTEHFEDGSGSVTLNIPISDQPRSQPKSFYVVIDRTESGAALGTRTLTMVTILPPD